MSTHISSAEIARAKAMMGRVLRTGLSSLRDRAANLRRRLASSSINPSRDQRPPHVIDAELRPTHYFYCGGCGDGPWHKSWTCYVRDPNDPAKRVNIAPCCSGAD